MEKFEFNSTEQIEEFNRSRFGVPLWTGQGIKLHHIGDIRILEYYPRKSVKGTIINEIDYAKKEFYVVGSPGYSQTLDEAIICALSIKYAGFDSSAGHYFIKMLDGIKQYHSEWTKVIRDGEYLTATVFDGYEMAKINRKLTLRNRRLKVLLTAIEADAQQILDGPFLENHNHALIIKNNAVEGKALLAKDVTERENDG